MFGDFGRAVSLLSIPIAYELGVLSIWQLFIVGFVNGTLTVFFDVADQSFLPAILESDDLIEGNSKLQISSSAAQVLGQPLGGGLVGLLSAPFAILLDAFSFVASGGLIFWIRKGEPKRTPPTDADGRLTAQPSIRAEIAEGLRYVLGHPYLRYIAAATGLSNLFSNIAFATFAVFTYRVLELTPFMVGVIGGVGSIGILLGALVAGRIAERIGVGRTILWSIALSGPATLIAAFAQPATAVPLLIALVFLASLDRRRLQHQPGQPAPGHHPRTDPGSDERDDALPRLGHDPDRLDRRRHPGLDPGGRGARRARHRRRARLLRVRADPVLAGPVAPADPEPAVAALGHGAPRRGCRDGQPGLVARLIAAGPVRPVRRASARGCRGHGRPRSPARSRRRHGG